MIWKLGCYLMISAAGTYVFTWFWLARHPDWLFGNVALLWLKTLRYVILGGLVLTILWAIDQVLSNMLFWRY